MNSTEYETARKAHDAALEVFNPIRDDYRDGKVDDVTFLEALAVMKDADKAFDAAFAAERDRQEAAEDAPTTAPDPQLELSLA